MDITPNKENERDIIEAARRGEPDAFEKILLLYEKRIYSYLYRVVGNRQDAEDLTQDTFIKLYKNIGSADAERNFKSWLYTIATHTAYDWLRKKRNRKELFLLDDPDSGLETIEESDPYYSIDAKTDIEDALTQLKPIHRAVLMLFYQQDLSYNEIADALTIPVNTIKTHLYRARHALKEVLQDHDYPPGKN